MLRDPTTIPPKEPAGRQDAAPDAQALARISRLALAALRGSAALVSRIEKGRVRVLAEAGPVDAVAGSDALFANRAAAIAAARKGQVAMATAADLRSFGAAIAVPVVDPLSGRTYTLAVLDRGARDWSLEDASLIEDLGALLAAELRGIEPAPDLAAAGDEQTMLLFREMEHRVKNSLSTVQALVSLSLQGDGPIAAMRDRLIERIGAMAKTQALLLQDRLESASLEDVIASEAGHYGADRVRWSGPPVRIYASDVTPIGMILHELGTNAAKHGALSPESAGRVDIRWSEERNADTARRLVLEWRESGGPNLVGAPDGEGFGTTLLDLLVSGQFRGEIDRSWNPDGLVFACRLLLAAEPSRFG